MQRLLLVLAFCEESDDVEGQQSDAGDVDNGGDAVTQVAQVTQVTQVTQVV